MKQMKLMAGGLLLAGCAVAAAGSSEAGAPRPPNILFIMSDDQGYSELGAFVDMADPNNLKAKDIEKWEKITECSDVSAPISVCLDAARKCMPNVDRLAKEGMRFTDFHTAPTCAPSRSALISARYPQRYGVWCNGDYEGGARLGFPLGVKFPVALLSEAGYFTGMSGKWHLGHQPGEWPHERGFDWFFGFDRAHTEKYGSKILVKNGKSVPADGWLADQTTDEAINFLKLADNKEQPFFLYVAYNEPHGPHPRPPQKYIDYIQSGSDNVDVHFALMYGMDCGIGRILKQVEAMGELDNTLIFFTTDNGQSQGPYHQGFKTNSYQNMDFHLVPIPGNSPFSGCKWTPWEGAVRTPLVVKMPGGQAGNTSDKLLSIMDIFPTILDYAGVDIPDSMDLDGKSFLPLLKGEQDAAPERTLFWVSDSQEPFPKTPQHQEMVRNLPKYEDVKVREDRFPPAWTVRTENWKLIGWDTLPPMLFKIDDDPGEEHDVAARHPETVQKLQAQFDVWIEQQANPIFYPEFQWKKLKRTSRVFEPAP